ncbi:hypothetical protein C7M84_002010 [Penaeus vannamei]|uniref:Rap-GAP domain-containing protein n=1 Tax=Penaeus vannamei TaxID=6689 RepID=A0A3R7N7H1_PENVA|nr:hypothetical protein C7M84_002010 [Penaeus vannamei]
MTLERPLYTCIAIASRLAFKSFVAHKGDLGLCHSPIQQAVKVARIQVSSNTVHPHFLEFLTGLGWMVNVYQHPGWTGHVSTAFTVTTPPQEVMADLNHGGSCFSGRSHVLYWSDALSEVAFVVPSPAIAQQNQGSQQSLGSTSSPGGIVLDPNEKVAAGGGGGSGSERSDSLPSYDPDVDAGSSLSSHTSQVSFGHGENRNRKFGRQTSAMACSDHKVFVVWLESFDDCYTFPANELLPESNRQGGQNAKLSMAGPLVDGQVVSRRVLGTLVRQTALNMCRRKRLESDSYQPPHVQRKLRIQEMVQKYRYEMNEPEFYTHLFTSPLC